MSMKNITNKPDFTKRTLTFGEVECYKYDKSLKDELKKGMTADDAMFLYKQMQYIRAFESVIIKLRNGELVPFEGYKFSGATHLSIGQEGSAVGANAALRPDDYITFTSNQDNPEYWNWNGINLNGSVNSEIKYAIIEYASTGIRCDYNSENCVNLENSILRNLGSGLENIKNSNIFYNDFLDINYTVFQSIEENVNITNNHISGKYRTVFNSIRNTNNIKYNNIDKRKY